MHLFDLYIYIYITCGGEEGRKNRSHQKRDSELIALQLRF